ncbi:DUF3237 domain-containing protein [Leucobacter tenebrionis]|uniref:DUF3237 domain-containing protein n=1 Tax=Leucobacter tenebrionis TaxID=2873270 RepID=UPI001CA7250F|nr:DUF3237 domain-containing protein [Leucobacter tenebrionis]QZY51704.1 DUF3237 domain-containing protein [Leucobacter tenebrionis]
MIDAAETALIEPALEYCFELRVDVADALPMGGSTEGEGLHFAPITGGAFEGPRLRGRILPGGGDWWHGRGLTVRLDARYVIEAEVRGDEHRNGEPARAAIDVVNRGYWRTDPESFERMLAGEAVDERDLYYRTAFTFQTEHPALQWLAESQFVGYARPEPGRVVIRVFRLA